VGLVLVRRTVAMTADSVAELKFAMTKGLRMRLRVKPAMTTGGGKFAMTKGGFA
jgi:hypothetical protein